MEKPYSPSCERNQQPILDVLKGIIKDSDKNLLEIGSGNGQHAVFMAPHFQNLTWHTSDMSQNHEGISLWINDSDSMNIVLPKEYTAGLSEFPQVNADIVYTANTLHIMSWSHVLSLVKELGDNLKIGCNILIYGPFKYAGQFTSLSNAEFDVSLKNNIPDSGIRDIESLIQTMKDNAMLLIKDHEMPANNRLLEFKRI
ncbi:MAG: DUF938 domain-containing protein [Marinicellaceae bacterium]